MDRTYRPIMFKNALEFLTGKSSILLKWPPWSMADIADFWSNKWEGEQEHDPEQPDSSDRTT
jgi:hypothetical protein